VAGVKAQFAAYRSVLQSALASIREIFSVAQQEKENLDKYAWIDLMGMIASERPEVLRAWPRYQIEIEAGQVWVRCNALSVRLVVRELLKNAAEAAKGGGKLIIICERHKESVCLSFQDDGLGVPKDIQERLFSSTVSTKGSTGQGLFRASRIMHFQVGKLSLDKEFTSGARFLLTLPSFGTGPDS
jgi:signal transduction histidine kinase